MRKEFLEHKSKTIESFNLVSNDISSINVNLVNLRTMLATIESRLSELNTGISQVGGDIRNFRADMELQNSTNASMASKIVDLNSFVNTRMGSFQGSIGKISDRLDSKISDSLKQLSEIAASSERNLSGKMSASEKKLKNFTANSRKISKKAIAASNALKKLLPRSKAQAAKTRKLSAGFSESQDEIRKIKNLITRKLRSMKSVNEELEAKLKSQRKRAQQLNRKIEIASGKKAFRRVSKRSTRRAARKIITKKITPKKTVTTIKTPKRKITKTVTPGKTVTKKETPKTKEVYEVIREKKPLI